LKYTDLCREITVEQGTPPVSVAIGDTVWWFTEAQLNNTPAVAFVVSFCEDNMIDLQYTTGVGNRLVTEKGVCLIGDERLKNVHNRKRGAWCPRATWKLLELK
jgi:hypothetical protein